MPYASVGEVELFYTDDGAGDPPLLFVHGYTCDSHDWSWQLPHFAGSRRVIAVDLRGHGRSTAPPRGYDPVELAGDLAGLLDARGVERVVAVGHSLGAVVVSALAVEHPDRVAALVAVDPAYLVPDELAAAWRAFFDGQGGVDPVVVAQQVVDQFDSPARTPAMRTWRLRRAAATAPHVLREALQLLVEGLAPASNSAPYLARRTCPVLSFYADPSRADVEAALFADERSRIVTWAGSGHWLQQERPAEFNAVVDEWLTSLSEPALGSPPRR